MYHGGGNDHLCQMLQMAHPSGIRTENGLGLSKVEVIGILDGNSVGPVVQRRMMETANVENFFEEFYSFNNGLVVFFYL